MLAMFRNLAVSLQRQFKRSVLMLTTQSVNTISAPYIEVVKLFLSQKKTDQDFTDSFYHSLYSSLALS